MKRVCIAAAAKLNLGLEVLGRRPDGYHEVKTVLQTVSVVDHLTVSESETLQLESAGLDLATEDNLAFHAARSITGALRTPPVSIDLKKTISTAAGLGGASSDAAATMRAILAYWKREIPSERMTQLAAELGSDVPFFLTGGTALATGRGEVITPLPPLPLVWFVIAVPELAIANKTATMYGRLSSAEFTDGAVVERIVEAIRSGRLPNWMSMTNAFTRPLLELHPQLRLLQNAFHRVGAPFVATAGAGPAQFTAVRDRSRADAIRAGVMDHFAGPLTTFVCSPLPAAPEPIVMLPS